MHSVREVGNRLSTNESIHSRVAKLVIRLSSRNCWDIAIWWCRGGLQLAAVASRNRVVDGYSMTLPAHLVKARRGVSASPTSTEGKGGLHCHSEAIEQKTGQNATASEVGESCGWIYQVERIPTLATPKRFPRYLDEQTSSGIGNTSAFDPIRTFGQLPYSGRQI